MQASWLSKKAEEIQSFADRKDMKKFHDALKTIYGQKSSGATPLLSADGSTLLTDKDAILKRWAEHFNSVLNRPSSVNDNAINRLPQIDTEVLKKAKMQSVHTLLKLAQLTWTGHVTRIPDERLTKKVLYGELQEGKRSQGGQKKRYKDTLKASLKDFNIPIESWEQAAQDRTKWRCFINKGASQFEEKRICEAERKRKERKARAKEPSSVSTQSEFTCFICNRQFRAKIGLYSH